ncbi:AEC family transporter, partial [Terrisporobacter muris]
TLYSGITLVVAIIISKLLLKPLKKEDKYIIQFSNVFSNCGFMGFPIIEGLYGKEGLVYASIFNVLFTIFMWTYGVGLFTGGINKKNVKKVFANPSIVAVFIGIIIMVFGIEIPSIIMKPIEMVGGITSALSMIIVGVILSNVNFKEYMKDISLYYGVFLKLLVVPIIVYIIMAALPGPTKVMKIIVLLHAMPTAAMLPIFAESFNKDKEYASVLLFMSTLFCVVTFPVVLLIVGQ